MADGHSTEAGSRVTIRTVAADAGVSVAAVSKVMRNAYGVSDALRLKVEASIERLGYRPSVAARGMRGRTFTLGVLLVGIDNPFLPGIYQGIESVTEAAGYKIMVGVGAPSLSWGTTNPARKAMTPSTTMTRRAQVWRFGPSSNGATATLPS
jgi:LacI family transcriptional regulator